MSRIDITVEDKHSGAVLMNRAFCREPHLRVFCGESNDVEVQNFAVELGIGLDLSLENIDRHLNAMNHVIQYLRSSITITQFEDEFQSPQVELEAFIADLESAVQFLTDLKAQEDLSQVEITIA